MGASYLKGSSSDKESAGEGAKLPELQGGRLRLLFIRSCRLPKLVPLVVHLLKDLGLADVELRVKSGEHSHNFLLRLAPVLLDAAEGALQGGNCIFSVFFHLANGEHKISNFIPKMIADLGEGAEQVAGMLLNCALRAHRVFASLAVGVYLKRRMILAARDPGRLGRFRQRLFQRNEVVSGGSFRSLVDPGTRPTEVLRVFFAVHSRVFFLAKVAFYGAVDVVVADPQRFRERANENITFKAGPVARRRECEGRLALVAAQL